VVDTRVEYHDLQAVYLPIAAAVFGLVALLVIVAVLRGRRREAGAGGGREGAPVAEVLYALGLAGLAAFLVGATFRTEAKVDPVAARPGLDVRVKVAKWRWRFDYPALGVSQVGGDRSPPLLAVPVGQTVRFTMTSLDVIHSFWIPDLRFKRDAFPGRSTRFDLVFDRRGFYSNGRCAEFCGLHHSDMTFVVQAMDPLAFAAWAQWRRTAGGGG
jgi:cytochrome c oxidase subunit II